MEVVLIWAIVPATKRAIKTVWQHVLTILNFLKRIWKFLSVYERKENLKKFCLWCIIILITLVPYFTSVQPVQEKLVEVDHDIHVNNPEIIPEVQYDINTILDYSTLFLWNNFGTYYTINKITFRHNVINIWIYSDTYRYSYNDLKKLGDYIKMSMPECRVVVIYNYPNRLIYGVAHYAV